MVGVGRVFAHILKHTWDIYAYDEPKIFMGHILWLIKWTRSIIVHTVAKANNNKNVNKKEKQKKDVQYENTGVCR